MSNSSLCMTIATTRNINVNLANPDVFQSRTFGTQADSVTIKWIILDITRMVMHSELHSELEFSTPLKHLDTMTLKHQLLFCIPKKINYGILTIRMLPTNDR